MEIKHPNPTLTGWQDFIKSSSFAPDGECPPTLLDIMNGDMEAHDKVFAFVMCKHISDTVKRQFEAWCLGQVWDILPAGCRWAQENLFRGQEGWWALSAIWAGLAQVSTIHVDSGVDYYRRVAIKKDASNSARMAAIAHCGSVFRDGFGEPEKEERNRQIEKIKEILQ